MSNVSIHPPKTPVTKGSNGIAQATLPNVCKMPGPPAPFVPTPLPNIAKSSSSPKGYSTSVTIQGEAVAIRGATFESMGDMASKGTGGGLVSANTHGPAKFITPGSMTVKIEGKNVHLLGEPMLNNCGPSGSPPNTGATLMGVKQVSGKKLKEVSTECPNDSHAYVTESIDRDKEIAAQKQRVVEAQKEEENAHQALADARKALDDRLAGKSKGPTHTKQLRDAIPKAEGRIKEKQSYLATQQRALRSKEWEKKVADECGDAENIKISCALCPKNIGDFDVVAKDGRVKEVKSSEGGYNEVQFEKYRKLVEDKKILGPGKLMKLAVPAAEFEAVKAKNPKLEGRLQGH